MPDGSSQLTAARITPAGRGAVATIRLQGNAWGTSVESSSGRFFCAANGLSLWDQPIGKIAFGRWGLTDAEDLVACRLADDVAEIHCHGGDAAVERILADLKTVGYAIVDWREQFALRTDTLETEGWDALSRSTTWRTTQILLEQTGGLLRQTYSALQQRDPTTIEDFDRALDNLLRWSNFGLHLTRPWEVVLTGRPNVGKSSLINALLGYQRAIVFDQPGTTRDIVTGETAFEGWPVTLADTAGIRRASGDIEATGIAKAMLHLTQADLQVVLIDVSQEPTADDFQILTAWPEALIVGHKADLPDRWDDRLPLNAHRVSSQTGQGMAALQKELVRRLIPEVPPFGTPIPITTRQVDRLREARTAQSPEAKLGPLHRLLLDKPA